MQTHLTTPPATRAMTPPRPHTPPLRPAAAPLRGTRIVSLALNLPGPAALLRLKALGARCLKVEPPAGDPMRHYDADAYRALHQGVRVLTLDLKAAPDAARLMRELARADLLLTSFRPLALKKLGLDWRALRQAQPRLSMVEIVGAPGARANEAGHDLTYQAEAGLLTGTALPPSLLADMGGALLAVEAALAALMQARASGHGVRRQVALSQAAQWLALPRQWTLMRPDAILGGAHAGYRVYACRDGRVALAALEPHFAAALFRVVGLPPPDARTPCQPQAQRAIAAWARGQSCAQLDALAAAHDLPLYTLPDR